MDGKIQAECPKSKVGNPSHGNSREITTRVHQAFFFVLRTIARFVGRYSTKERLPTRTNVYAKLMIRYGAWMFACDLFKLHVAILSFVGLSIVALSLPSSLRTCLKL